MFANFRSCSFFKFVDFEIKNLSEYHDLHLRKDTVLLADVFQNFGRMCLEISTRSHNISFSSRISMKSHLRKTKVELQLLTDIDMLLMVEKRVRGGLCHSINRCAKANDKYMKDYDKNEESSYLKYWYVNNLYGCQCRKRWW